MALKSTLIDTDAEQGKLDPVQLHLPDLHGVLLLQEHLIIFRRLSGTKNTPSGTVTGTRDVKSLSIDHPYGVDARPGGLASRT